MDLLTKTGDKEFTEISDTFIDKPFTRKYASVSRHLIAGTFDCRAQSIARK